MKIKDLMTAELYTLTKKATLKSAAGLFIKNKIDGAPVVDNEGKLIGLITKRHIMEAFYGGRDQRDSIENIITKEIITIDENAKPAKAWKMPVGRLPVVDRDGKLKGILTRTDLVNGFYNYNQEILEKLKTILASTRNAIVAINNNGIIEIFNNAAAQIVGVEKNRAIGSSIREILPYSGLLDVVKSGKAEIAKKLKIDNKIVISNRNPLIKNDEIIGAVGIFQDISDLTSISEELKYSQNLNRELDGIIEAISDGIYITDGKGYTTRINSTYEKISGIKGEQVIGRHMKDLVDEGYYSESVTLHVLKEKKPVTITHEIRTGIEVMVTGTPVFDEEGNIIRVVTTVRDMKKLSKMRKELDETKKLKARYYNELEILREQQLEMDDIVIESSKMKDIVELAIRLGHFNSTVLITGESGVGKEIVAKIIHRAGHFDESKGSFIKINCGAIPESLLESELFGYEKGAFTGAKKQGKPGLFELAEDGTLLLDEIGELPLSLQVKLLRALQEREIYRIGGTEPIKINTRIIAATNKELKKQIKKGKFREDLYYRLNVVPINVPPLRSRKKEIIPMIHHFLLKYNKKFNTNKKLALNLLKFFENYKWPGNVRQLENTIERLIVTVRDEVITIEHLHSEFSSEITINEFNQGKFFDNSIVISHDFNIKKAVANLEKKLLKKAKEKATTTRKMASLLGVSQPTVVRKLKKYNL